MTGRQHAHEFAAQAGWRRHGNKVQEGVKPENEKYQPQQGSGDDDGDFHDSFGQVFLGEPYGGRLEVTRGLDAPLSRVQAARKIENQKNNQDKSKATPANQGAAKVIPAAAEQQH